MSDNDSTIEVYDADSTENNDIETTETEPSFGAIVAQTFILSFTSVAAAFAGMAVVGGLSAGIESWNESRLEAKKAKLQKKLADLESVEDDTNSDSDN